VRGYGLDAPGSEQGPVAGSCEHCNEQVPQKAGNFLTSSVTISVSRKTLLHRVNYK
jgi:hypothetical protein